MTNEACPPMFAGDTGSVVERVLDEGESRQAEIIKGAVVGSAAFAGNDMDRAQVRERLQPLLDVGLLRLSKDRE